MATPVLMPKQGNSVESCIIVQWMKNEGDQVNAGDVICEIETDKSTFEVEAPASGVLIARFFEADDDVPVMINIAAIGEAGEDVSDLRPAETAGSAIAGSDAAADSNVSSAVSEQTDSNPDFHSTRSGTGNGIQIAFQSDIPPNFIP